MKMEDYLIKMKNLVDKLKFAGNPILTSDLTIQTLNDLDSGYNLVVIKLSDQTTLNWVYLQAQLLTFESRVEQMNNLTNLNPNATTNIANKSNYRGNKFNSNNNWRGSNFRENDKQESRNAFLASQNFVQDYDWYFDSDASNHVTHQAGKFQDLTAHHGNFNINDTTPVT
ncbi:hypothetical protein KIW84_020142 [Lathyrus oleraceus]|uniref:Retrovirus-related Pol polyprotein from transposon TNT 1-94 n=1 Tax=Pisum sativum TaxID=3888 RepID=A0A9D5B7G8_PEA|nr:hypothetical protein KIW84_020142 [Pisum sativum]